MFYFAKLAFILVLIKGKGSAGSIIISSPQQLYLLDGDQGTVRCQNRSDNGDHFYSYINNAVWYRYYDNGSNATIGTGSGTVYSRGYTLKFNSILAEDEGHYFCCAQNEQCSKELTTATISNLLLTVPPIIRANGNYTAEVGSQITLACSIINQGVPTAHFRWIRDGIEQLGDNVVVNALLGLVTMTLTNVTMNDGGTYTCMATSERSSRSDQILLTVTEKVEANISDTNYTFIFKGVSQLLVNFDVSPCQTTMKYLSEFLASFVRTQYDQSVTATVNQTECINVTTALFELTLTGPGPDVKHTLDQLLNDIYTNVQGLDIGIGVIKTCEQNCTVPTVASGPSSSDDDDHNEKLIYIAVVVVVAVAVALILMILSVLVICKRRRATGSHDNDVVIKRMHKINTTPNMAESAADTQYNKLQFPKDDPTSIKNTLELKYPTGYVEPQSIRNENKAITSCFPSMLRAAKSSKQKPVVTSTPNGTGIVRVGTLQAVIPSHQTPDNLDDFKIVPSPTHESYVDVVKQSV